MDKPLSSPLMIEPVGRATRLTSAQVFKNLQGFVDTLPASTARTQLERLADALGVETGAIEPSEGERREKEREAARAAARAERRERRKAEAAAAAAASIAELDQAIEAGDAEMAASEEDEAEEEGLGVGDFDDVPRMDDRGDVEYGDIPTEDEDEPDNQADEDN